MDDHIIPNEIYLELDELPLTDNRWLIYLEYLDTIEEDFFTYENHTLVHETPKKEIESIIKFFDRNNVPVPTHIRLRYST